MLKPLISQFYGKPIQAITVLDLRTYVVELRERQSRYTDATQRPEMTGGLSHESFRGHIRALRRFFSWAYQEYELDLQRNPALRIRMPPREQMEPKSIDLDDLRLLLEATDDTPFGIRDRAMIAFLADTGCRAAGMLTLTMPDLHMDRRMAVVIEKGQRARAVPFTDYTEHCLLDWLRVRPNGSDTVFCALGGKNPGEPLTLSGLHCALKRLKKASGITGRVNPHSFRHGFAKRYLDKGGDTATLSQLMGHSSVTTTVTFYARFYERELFEKHKRFSPMAGWKDNE